ncbi:hypothetical protein Scep_009172 [Stephania cephalantha]|uniref:Uncharacterized protein n=1 Tax=Stephania cephalantha TaxID=152367 RepID=A0AAP0JSL0_9MAGN
MMAKVCVDEVGVVDEITPFLAHEFESKKRVWWEFGEYFFGYDLVWKLICCCLPI